MAAAEPPAPCQMRPGENTHCGHAGFFTTHLIGDLSPCVCAYQSANLSETYRLSSQLIRVHVVTTTHVHWSHARPCYSSYKAYQRLNTHIVRLIRVCGGLYQCAYHTHSRSCTPFYMGGSMTYFDIFINTCIKLIVVCDSSVSSSLINSVAATFCGPRLVSIESARTVIGTIRKLYLYFITFVNIKSLESKVQI